MSPVERIRVLPELRAVQVARERNMVPVETWYFSTNYDLEGTAVPDTFVRVRKATAVWRLLTTRATVLEVPEPLWIRFLPTSLLLVVVWRLSGFLRLKNRRARTFAIENNDVVSVVCGSRRPIAPLRWLILFSLGAFVRLFYERVVFGTPGAEATYRTLPFFGGVESTTVLGLPTPAPETLIAPVVADLTAVFIGHLDDRKGVQQLMDAWSLVEADQPAATLVVVGRGPLQEKVAVWAGSRSSSRHFMGQIPYDDISSVLVSSAVVVVPSRRSGRWREQIGLPIEEGLAHGLTVVTTSETGLAQWLGEHGHYVLASEAGPIELAAAISAALEAPIPRGQVAASLPNEHARITADRWLHSA